MFNKELVLLSALLLVIFVPFAYAAQTLTFTVDVLSSRVAIFSLGEAVEFNGSFTVSGGSANDIDFYVIDPNGEVILDLGRVRQQATFQFTTGSTGPYTLRFDNGFSWFSPKTVTLSFEVDGETPEPIIPRNVQISAVVEAAIIISLVLASVVAAILLKHARKTKQSRKT